MNTIPLTQTEALWNQRFQLNPGLKAGSDNEARFYVENSATQAKYLLQGWQMALLGSFETGEATVADCVRETAGKFPGEIQEPSVRQFCQWVLDERLANFVDQPGQGIQAVAAASQPVPSVQPRSEEASEPFNPIAQATLMPEPNETQNIPAAQKPRPRRGSGAFGSLVKIAACIAVGLGTWKFTTTVLPIVNGASTDHLAVVGSHALESQNASASSMAPAQINVADALTDSADVTEVNQVDRATQLKTLRNELAGAQVERDESYDKSDEAAYRTAVQKIAKITHRIGEIQAEMKTERATESPGVAYGAANSIRL